MAFTSWIVPPLQEGKLSDTAPSAGPAAAPDTGADPVQGCFPSDPATMLTWHAWGTRTTTCMVGHPYISNVNNSTGEVVAQGNFTFVQTWTLVGTKVNYVATLAFTGGFWNGGPADLADFVGGGGTVAGNFYPADDVMSARAKHPLSPQDDFGDHPMIVTKTAYARWTITGSYTEASAPTSGLAPRPVANNFNTLALSLNMPNWGQALLYYGQSAYRCDSGAQLASTSRAGCVFQWVPGILDYAWSKNPDFADEVSAAQVSGLPGQLGVNYLHRTRDQTTINRNTAAACPPSIVRQAPAGKQCDEYPFKTTSEGAYSNATSPRSFRV